MIRIDQLPTTLYPSLLHVFAAMKDNDTVQLSLQQVLDLVKGAIVGAAPGTLDTLDEIAAALNDNPNQINTILTEQANRLKLDGSNLGANGPALRAALGTLSDDLQVQQIGTPVAAVDFDIPATGGLFLLLGTNVKVAADTAIGYRTSFNTAFDAGATDYDYRWLSVGSTVTTGTAQGNQGYFVNGQESVGIDLISTTFMALINPGAADMWSSSISLAGGYSSGNTFDIGSFMSVRRAAGRISKLRIYSQGVNMSKGKFALARIRGVS